MSGGKEGQLKICDFRKLSLETVCCNERINDISISPNADKAAVIHSNSLIRLYDLSSFETLYTVACVKSVIVKYRTEGLFVLSVKKFTALNNFGIVFQKDTNWSYPLHISSQNNVVSRELGLDVWNINAKLIKTQGIDLEKLVKFN